MLRLTKHAQEAMEKRKLARDWIERTVAMPDFTRAYPNDPALTHSFKAIDEAVGRTLKVVHRRDIVVVTAHFDRDAKP